MIYNDRCDNMLFLYVSTLIFGKLVIFKNVSFFIFFALLYTHKKKYNYYFKLKGLENIFAILFGLSSIFCTIDLILKQDGSFNIVKALGVLPNYLYWSILLLFIFSHRQNFNLNIICRGIFYGLLSGVLYHFTISNYGIWKLVPFLNYSYPNIFAFLLIAFGTIGTYYVYYNHGLVKSLIVGMIFILAGFASGSRAASGLVLLQHTLFYIQILSKKANKLMIIPLISFFAIMIYITISSSYFWDALFYLNPRIAFSLENIDWLLKRDTNYLIRVAQWEKGLLLFKENPFTGIGLLGFNKINIYQPLNFEGAQFIVGKSYAYNASSFNSYIMILAEGGLSLFLPFIALVITGLVKLVFNFKLSKNFPFLISYLGGLIHFWFISAIVNSYAWFFIGICLSVPKMKRLKKK